MMPSWMHLLCDNDKFLVGFTGRGRLENRGHISEYDSFNICHYTGDNLQHIESCREMLSIELGIDEGRIIVPRQSHTCNVSVLDNGADLNDMSLIDIDGIVTKERRLLIGVNTADCLPVIIADSVNGVIGVAHAGWRGAVGGIIDVLIEKMIGVRADMAMSEAFIGPAICQSCFEVGEEVAALFPDSDVDRNGIKPHVNLHAFASERLMAGGISPERIHVSPSELCTRCHPDKFFSARFSGIVSGRNYSFVMLK